MARAGITFKCRTLFAFRNKNIKINSDFHQNEVLKENLIWLEEYSKRIVCILAGLGASTCFKVDNRTV